VPRISDRGKEITPKNRKKRFLFAQLHDKWSTRDWSKIVFADESKLFPHKTRTRVLWAYNKSQRAPPFEESFENKSINVWGYLRYDGVVELFRFEGTMRQGEYIEMIEDKVDHAIAPLRGGNSRLTFMQDNASYHTAESVKKWFHRKRLNLLT